MSEKATLVHLPYAPGTKDYTDSITAGYYGYAILLTMSVCNFMFYGDFWYRRVILSKSAHWGAMLQTIWGVQAVLRPLINYSIWAIIGFFAALAIVDSPSMYVSLGTVASYMGIVYAIRSFLVILVMVIGMFFDDPKTYTNFGDDTNTDDRTLFRYLYAWGNDIRLYMAVDQLFINQSSDEYYNMLDIQLEALNILGGAAAYSFFDIGLKIWEPLAKMGISFVPKDMKLFRKALYMKKLKVYERKFNSGDAGDAEVGAGAGDEQF